MFVKGYRFIVGSGTTKGVGIAHKIKLPKHQLQFSPGAVLLRELTFKKFLGNFFLFN